ncbi:hypothetical protein G4B84_002956 [Aspergillus flavus NRRL3357]|nr:uncharacterized protein G4B84_002956 [Aspergillus flavus NRRL3357]QMW27667.1 hypothetical protein G4B84_002956 [Aspergillus flavus NRRL3357]QMW39738.1 hypothetical protein G4B11_003018 [Aspergillus flavus]
MRQKRPPGSILKYTQSFNLNPFKLNLEHGGLEINDQFQIEVGDFVARVIPDSISMERINHFREQNSDALFDLLALSITPRHFLYGKESPEGTEDRGLLGFAWLQSTLASPIVSTDSPNIIVTHRASDLFPEFEGDLSPFDVDVEYVGYEAETRAWLAALDPSSANTDEEKAVFLTRQPTPRTALGGNSTAIEKRAGSRYTFEFATRHKLVKMCWYSVLSIRGDVSL